MEDCSCSKCFYLERKGNKDGVTYRCLLQNCDIKNPEENSCSSISMTSGDTGQNSTQADIEMCLDSMKALLIEKNKRYGNSALQPLNVFSKQDSSNSICIRLDDKLGRIRNSKELRKNDIADMIGYLTLLCVSEGWTDFSELID